MERDEIHINIMVGLLYISKTFDMSELRSLSLRWSGNIKKEKKEACRRNTIRGVEVRDLGKDHILCGEKVIYREKVLKLHDYFLVHAAMYS